MTFETPQALRMALERRLLARSNDTGLALDRLRRRVLFERIIARLEAAEPGRWVLKGGMALEVRLADDARVTKDIDLGLRDEVDDGLDLQERVASALGVDLEGDGFRFTVTRPSALGADGAGHLTWRLSVGVALAGKPFGGIRLDVSPRAHELDRTDRLALANLLDFAGVPAPVVEVIDVHRHASESEAGRIGSHRFMSYTPILDRIDPSWARWFFVSEPGLKLLRLASPGSAGRNRTLAIERFEALEIPLPPIEEQRRVAEQLGKIRRTSDEATDAVAASPPGVLVGLLPALVDELLAEHSSGVAPVREVADFVSDTVHPGDLAGPADVFIGLQHIESHTGRRIGHDSLGLAKGRKFRFRPGDVVYGYLRPYQNKVWVADRHGLCSVDQYVLRPQEEVSAEVLAAGLRGRRSLASAIKLTHSLQLPRLRSKLLGALPVPIVAEGRTTRVVEEVQTLTEQVSKIVSLRRHQKSLAAALLPAALNEAFAGLS